MSRCKLNYVVEYLHSSPALVLQYRSLYSNYNDTSTACCILRLTRAFIQYSMFTIINTSHSPNHGHIPTPQSTSPVWCTGKDGKQEIIQQPADLTTLYANLAVAASNFVEKQAG